MEITAATQLRRRSGSLADSEIIKTHIDLDDGTLRGIAASQPAAVQRAVPSEASPGRRFALPVKDFVR